MQQQGYDSLSEHAQKTLEDTLKQVEGNAATQEQVIAMMLKRVEKNYDGAYNAIQAKIKQTGTVVGTTTQKQIKDINGTLAPLQAWATQVQANEQTLSEFNQKWDTVVNNISTNPIRFMPQGAQDVLTELGLLTEATNQYTSAYERMMNALEAGGQQKTVFNEETDNKAAEQAVGETASQAANRRTILAQMYKWLNDTGKIATHEDIVSNMVDTTKESGEKNAKDKLWQYIYELTGKSATAKDMVHLGNYLKDKLGYQFTNTLPYESKVTEATLTTAMREEILKGLKTVGWGTNQGAANFASTRPLATSAIAKDKLWTYLYNVTGRNLSEADMLHIGKAYTNVAGLPTEASGTKLTNAQKEAILLALQYNGFDLKDYVLSANYKTMAVSAATSYGGTSPTTKTTNTQAQSALSSVAVQKEPTLEEYIKGMTGKTPTTQELITYGKEVGALDKNKTYTTLSESDKKKIYDKIKSTGWTPNKNKGYAKGTTSIPYTGTHWTHSGELLVRKDGAYLTPLSKGDGVIPANLTENLMKWGAIDPTTFAQMKMPTIPSKVDQSTNITNNYESLLTVHGDVTKDALPELQDILKQACDYTNKYNAREARKLGRK